MRLIDDDQVPVRLLDVRLLRFRKLVRAENDGILLEGVEIALADRLVEASSVVSR